MKTALIIVTLLVTCTFLQAQNKMIAQLKADNKTEISLYFYPSTLRMMNLQHNEAFDELVKDIKKMSFLKLNKGQFDDNQFYNFITDLQNDADLEEYVVIDGKNQKLYLLGTESPASTVAMAFFENEYYAIDIAGSISLAELPKLFEKLSQGDASLKNDFSSILNLVGSANSFGNNHRERNRD